MADRDKRLLGIVTDGDIRDALLRGASLDAPITQSVTTTPTALRAVVSRPPRLRT
jgi:CBS domain-containing protein